MDLLRIALRALFVFVTMLALVRASGKRTVKHGSAFEFTLALILGDLFDNAIWAEVPLSQFLVAAVTLMASHLLMDRARFRTGLKARPGIGSASRA